MPVVRLGNTAAHSPGNQITSVLIPADRSRQEAVRDITHSDGLWAQHSTAPAPAWLESDDPEIAAALGLIYGCPVGRPEDWEVQE